MWALVVIKLLSPLESSHSVDAKLYDTYYSFDKCAMAREELILDTGKLDGFPKPNMQFVCVRVED
jgi:hypothetical protein